MKQVRLLISFLFLSNIASFASGKFTLQSNEGNDSHSWTSSPFDQKVFIENKGQFALQMDNGKGLMANGNTSQPSTILFGVNNNGVTIYFTPSGITYWHDERVRINEKEDTTGKQFPVRKEKSNRVEEEERNFQLKTYSLNMQWVGANPNVQPEGEEEVNNYFTYSDLKDKSGKSTIKARAFKKIIYKNIYPHIDVVYEFPTPILNPSQREGLGEGYGTSGIKYSLILHPGANPNVIQMKYDGAEKLFADADGNIKIESSFGEFVDHAPKTFYEGGENISSAFQLKDNIVSFKLNLKSKISNLKSIIIDPWTTIPVFSGTNKAYDIDWDYLGNIYIYGGVYPFQLIKINNIGAIQWTYNCTVFGTSSGDQMYGDFAVDRMTGTSYICEGMHMSPGARILKVNTLGNQIALFPGDARVNEFTRIAINSCTHQGVLGCGNVGLTYQAALFDTNMTNITPTNPLSTSEDHHDITLLALDDTNCYMATNISLTYSTFNNVTFKLPAATLSSPSYIVNNGHTFSEFTLTTYVAGIYTSGFNGMAKSKKYLYTYDGAVLKKWNPWSGAFISSITVSANTFQCGGIAVDACDNVYVGCINSVKQYDSTLTSVNSVATSGTVYDLMLGIGGEIFACGDNFVSAMNFFSPCSTSSSFTLNTTYSPSTCAGNDGSAAVTVTGGNPPFNYYWSPGGQTTSSITGLAPGTYQVVVFEANGVSCSNSGVNTAIIAVTASSGFTAQSHTVTPITCFGNNNATATEMVSGGTAPYTFLWSPGGQTTPTITGLSPGTYTVTVTDNAGCKTIDIITINLVNVLTANPVVQNIGCYGYGSINLYTSGGTSPYTYLWSTGETDATIYVYTPGTYTVTVQDANGCSVTQSINVTQSLPWTISSVNVYGSCIGNNDSIVIHFSGGGSTLSFYWYDSFGNYLLGDSVITGLSSGTYCCYLYDYMTGCSDSICATVGFVATISQINPSCIGPSIGSAWVSFTTGTPPYTYSWSTIPVQTTDTVAGLAPGIYTCTIIDSNGCQTIDTVTIAYLTVTPVVQNINCSGYGSITLNTSGGTSPYTFLWSTGDITQTIYVYTPGTYTVTVQDANGCSVTQSINVTQSLPWTISSVNVYGSCIGNNDSIVIHFSAGGSTLSFYWYDSFGNPLFGDSIITNLSAGTYCCYLYDYMTGCVDSICATVGFVVTISQINPSCIGPSTGTAWVSAATGTPPYTYSWSTTPVQTTDTVAGLAPGIYTCLITDSNGCQTIDSVTIAQLTATPFIQNINCSGYGSITVNTIGGAAPYTYAWSTGDITSSIYVFTPGTYSVTVYDANGCSTTLGPLTVTGASLWSISSVTVGNACNGNNGTITITLTNGSSYSMVYYWQDAYGNTIGNYLDSTITGLSSGTYYCYVYDNAFCYDTSITITISNSSFSLSVSQTNSFCNNSSGTATVTVTAGAAPYTYNWNPSAQNTQTATGLGAGTYTVTVTDANGCTQTQTVVLTSTLGPTATAWNDTTIMAGSSVILNSSSNPPFVIYQWSPADGLSCSTCANPTATPTATTEYCVEVTDANNCTDTACVTVTVEIPCDSILYLPNAFSPNNDGENDFLRIYYDNMICIKTFALSVYDRFGEDVFETTDANFKWDGTYQLQMLNTQVLTYSLHVEFTDKTLHVKKGNISLLR